MKKKVLLFALAGFFLLGSVSCSSDDSGTSEPEKVEVPNTLKDDYFSIDGATFNAGNIQGGEKNSIAEISVNNFVINGGKAIMTLTCTEELKSVLIGLKGHDGFYELQTTNELQTRDRLYRYEVILDLSQNLNLEVFGLEIVGYITDGTRTVIYYREFQLIPAGTGELQISLSWDKEDDVDLHLVKQDQGRIYYGSKTLFAENSTLIAELDIDSNPGCSIDGIKNENIYFNHLADGVYAIYVDLYSKCEASGSTGSKYIVNVTYGGTSIRLSDHMIGKFNDDDSGSGNTLSRHVHIGSFSIVDGQFSSIVETDSATSIQAFNLEEKLVYKK
ncbi:hypothetical protein [Myroides sp. WP-1]|uniref:hypothetical protein n=1 Tax=Myroides sp. WP-1 TaxID=2759944 RepID=UPI0015F91BFE|nr:hypothetical protein [Myroides sp. WP-1]MBB1139903.1 hypothetical protein [Myroides sp. WP-1]